MRKRILTEDDLRDINSDIDELFQSGVETNRILVDALNSKNVWASTNSSIKTNARKVNDIKMGDYSIGDILKFEDVEPYEEIVPNNPSRAWSKSLPEDGEDIAQDKDYIYVVSNYSVTKFDKSTGSQKWKKTLDSSHSCVTVDKDGNVYVSGFLEPITKLDSNGSVVWEKKVGSKGYRHLKYYNGYIYGSGDSSLSKISTNGSVSWNKDDIGIKFGSLDVRNDYIYVIELNKGQVSKYNINGNKVWSKGGNDNICVTTAGDLVKVNSKNYIHVRSGEFGTGVLIYNSNGSKINQFDKGNSYFDIDDDDILYIAYVDITAYSPNYNPIWEYELLSLERATPLLAGFNRDLYYINKKYIRKLNIDGSQQVGYRIIK